MQGSINATYAQHHEINLIPVKLVKIFLDLGFQYAICAFIQAALFFYRLFAI